MTTLQEKIAEAIKDQLRAELEDLNLEEIIEKIAEDAIHDEIGDTEVAARLYIAKELADWKGNFGAQEIMEELIDQMMY